MKTSTSISTKLYPDQLDVWEEIRAGRSNADALRDVIAEWCEMRGIDFPEYETGGRGGIRRGKEAIQPTPKN